MFFFTRIGNTNVTDAHRVMWDHKDADTHGPMRMLGDVIALLPQRFWITLLPLCYKVLLFLLAFGIPLVSLMSSYSVMTSSALMSICIHRLAREWLDGFP